MKLRSTPKAKIFCAIYSTLLVLLAGASWALNFGWTRLILSFTPLPLFHAVGLFFLNFLTLKYLPYSKTLTVFNILFNVTYALFYVLMPDSAGAMYFFFGLIHDFTLNRIAFYLTVLLATAHIIFFIFNTVYTVKTKNKIYKTNK